MDIYKIVVLILLFSGLKASSQNDSNFEETVGATTLSAVSFISPITIPTALTKTTSASTESSETAITDKKEESEIASSGLEPSSELSTSKEDLSEKITSDVEVSSESARSDRYKDQVRQYDDEEESSEITKSIEEELPVLTTPNVEISYENTTIYPSKGSEITREMEETSNKTTLKREEYTEIASLDEKESTETTALLEESSKVTTPNQEKSSEIIASLEDSAKVTSPNQEKSSEMTATLEESSKVTTPNQEKSSEMTATQEDSSKVTTPNQGKSSEITALLEDSAKVTTPNQEKSSEMTATLEESSKVTTPGQEESSEIAATLEESSEVTTSSQEKSSKINATLEKSSKVTLSSQEDSSEITATLEESSKVYTPSQEKSSSEITSTLEALSKVTTPSQENSFEIVTTLEKSYKVTTPGQEESSESPILDQEGSNDSGITTSNRISSDHIASDLDESSSITTSSLEKSSESEESSEESSEITTSNLEDSIEITTPKQEEPSVVSFTTTSLLPTKQTEKAGQTETTTMPLSTETSTTNNSGIKELSTDGIYVQVLGKSGKFVIGRTRNPQNDPNKLMVTFDSIQEKDGNGNNVGTSGRFKHSFNNFAGQNFEISKLTDDKYQNLAVKRLDCTAYLDTVESKFTVQIFLFREEGSVSQGDEVSRVSKGTLKFNIMVEDWKFCGSDGMECRKGKQFEYGEFIDFALSIKGSKPPNNRINKRTNAQEFDMGGNASVVLFKQAKYDESSANENLPQGFPQIIQKGSRQLFVFRFRKFSTSVFYDPLLNIDANVTTAEQESLTTVPPSVSPLNANITTVTLSEETPESKPFTSTSIQPLTISATSLLTYAPSTTVPSSTTATSSLKPTTKWTSMLSSVTWASSLRTHTPTSLTETITTLNRTPQTTTKVTMMTPTSVTTDGIISTHSLTTLVTTTPLDDYSPENTKELSTDSIYVRVLKNSGKFVMGRTKNPQNDPNKLMVTFDSIQEKDSSGNNVGTSGRFKHSFNNFAGQKFDVSELSDDRYQSLAVKRLDCTTYLDTVGASLTVQIFLFREKGTVSQGDEVSHVSKGTLKFNIIIENWKFCGSNGVECTKGKQLEYGEFIDFTMSIKGSKFATKKDKSKRTSAKEFYLGGNSSVVLSEKVKYDDGSAYENLPQGFPQLIQRGSRQSFLFRFRKFDKTVFYDPQLNVDGSMETDKTKTSTTDTENNPLASSNLAPVPAEISSRTAFLRAEGLTVKIHGQSGKMTIGYSEDPDQDSNKVQVTFDAIGEIATDGTEIGQAGQQTHTFNTFANLDFSFSQIKDDRYMNLSSKRVDFSANFPSTGARLVVQVFVFTQAGEISIDGERTAVTAGTVKFNILVESWSFCGYNGVTCTKGNVEQRGEAIDFTISVKGKGDQQVRTQRKKTDGEEFDLGGEASLLLSRKIQRDGGAYEPMPSGYPLLSGRGSKTVFILRFPRFNTSVLYDPLIVLSQANHANNCMTVTFYQVLTFVLILTSGILI